MPNSHIICLRQLSFLKRQTRILTLLFLKNGLAALCLGILAAKGFSTVFSTTKNGLGLVGHGDASREVYEEVLKWIF